MLQASTLQFLKALKKHNSKEWFEEHRKAYEAAKQDFTAFVQQLIDQFGKKDPAIGQLQAKDCLFRINRDVRFSKNKAPYKTNFGASINKGGKKSLLAGYYLHCEPGQSFAGGGIWMPAAPELKKLRQEIDYNPEAFTKIVTAKPFVKVYGSLYNGEDAALSSMPRGYEKDNPAAAYLKLKSYLGMQPLTDADLTGKALTKKVLAAFEALQPLISFINQALDE